MRSSILAQHPNNKGVTIIELLIVICAFLLIIVALTPFVNMAKARSYRFYCADNLRKISLGLHAYAADHNDSFPASLNQLYPQYVDSEKAFDCPATKDKANYKYIFGLTESASPREIIVEDFDGNHRKYGKNVLRIDGAVEWIGQRR